MRRLQRPKILVVMLCLTSMFAAYSFWARSALSPIPRGYPPIAVPDENQMTREKIELGRILFYDRRLSINASVACADCHQQRYAFSDSRPKSIAALGDPTRRNAMSLTNVAYNSRYTWADDRLQTLEAQAHIPLTLDHPVEMGFQRDPTGILQRFRQDPQLLKRFQDAFTDESEPVTLINIVRAISSFERIMISARSPYDRHWAGDATALNDAAKRGMALFKLV